MTTQQTPARTHFIRELSEALADFLTDTLCESSSFPLFGSKSRVGVGSEHAGHGKISLLLRGIETEGKPIEEPFETTRLNGAADGRFITIRSPWAYRLAYALTGPRIDTTEGMTLAGKTQAVLFDHPILPAAYLEQHHLGFLSSVALHPGNGITRRSAEDQELDIVANLYVEFMFATGTPVAVEQQVTRRTLRLGASNSNPTTREN